MKNMILGLFANRADAESAYDKLRDLGIPSADISVIMRRDEKSETIKDSAAQGALTGGVIGGLAGLLVGLGTLALPGIGTVLVGGPLIAALGLTGAAATAATTVAGGVTGAVAGGLVGALIGLGIPEEDAQLYEKSIKEGAILVAVNLPDDNDRAIKEILVQNHASDLKTLKTADTSPKTTSASI